MLGDASESWTNTKSTGSQSHSTRQDSRCPTRDSSIGGGGGHSWSSTSSSNLSRSRSFTPSSGSKRRSARASAPLITGDLLLEASNHEQTKDEAARRQVVYTIGGAALIFISCVIMTIAFVVTLLHTRDALYREGLEIRRRSVESVTQETARVLEPVYAATRQLSEQARAGVATGSRIWPPSRETFEARYPDLIAKLWIQMEGGMHAQKALGGQQEKRPSIGLWAQMCLREDLQTPSTSMEDCAHVLQVALLDDTSMLPPASREKFAAEADSQHGSYRLACRSFIGADAAGGLGHRTELRLFDTRTAQLLPGVLDELEGMSCVQMRPLLQDPPMLKAFGNFSWQSPLLEQQVLYGNAPLYTPDRQRRIGSFGAFVPLHESLSRLLLEIQTEGGHFSQGAELAIVTAEGQLLGATARMGGVEGDPAAQATPFHVDELAHDSLLKQAIKDVRQKAAESSPCPSHHLSFDEGDRLVDAIPFHAEDYGLAPLNETWCVIQTLPRENMYEALDFVKDLRIVTGGLNVAIFLSAILLVVASLCLALASGRGARAEKLRADLRKALSAVKDVESLNSPMVLVSASVFMSLSQLEQYETLRDRGALTVLDTLEDVVKFKQRSMIIFFSHQWLSLKFPDTSDGVQLAAMKAAIRTVYSDPAMDKEVYVWCDFTSIAQRHATMQQAAIASLPVYASVADKFIIIAPPAIHEDLHVECNLATYNQRGWCRAEMLATACGSGIREMYICADTAGTLSPIFAEDLASLSLNIFEGKFTVPEDAESLVKPALGLYALVLRDQKLPHMEAMHAHIQDDKEKFFPRSYYNSNRGEQVELFGSCVGALEAVVEAGNDSWGGSGSFSRQ